MGYHRTTNLFIPNRRKNEVGTFLTTIKGMRAKATRLPPSRSRVKQSSADMSVNSLKRPEHIFPGGVVERYAYSADAASCQCNSCVVKRTTDDDEGEEFETQITGALGAGEYAPEYIHVAPGALPFEEIWEQALDFPKRYRTDPRQWFDAFEESDHPRGQPENAGEFSKSKSDALAKSAKTKLLPSSTIHGELDTGVPYRVFVNPSKNTVTSLLKNNAFSRVFAFDGNIAIAGGRSGGSEDDVIIHYQIAQVLANDGYNVVVPNKNSLESPYSKLTISKATKSKYSINGSPVSISGAMNAVDDASPVPANALPEGLRVLLDSSPSNSLEAMKVKHLALYAKYTAAVGGPKALLYKEVKASIHAISTARKQQAKTHDAFEESDHPRGQPENAGEFAKGHGVTRVKKKDSSVIQANTQIEKSSATSKIGEVVIPPEIAHVVKDVSGYTSEDLDAMGEISYKDYIARSEINSKFIDTAHGYAMQIIQQALNAQSLMTEYTKLAPLDAQKRRVYVRTVVVMNGDYPAAAGNLVIKGKTPTVGYINRLGSTVHGAGISIMHNLIEDARRKGMERIELDPLVGAVPFYKKIGFKSLKKKGEYRAHIMSLSLVNATKDVFRPTLDSVRMASETNDYIAGITTDAFEESDHPRGQPENAGEFSTKEGSNKKVSPSANFTKAMPDRSDFPEHIKKLVLPPAWKDIHYNPDPNGDLLATGRDKKNNLHSVFSPKILATRALAKFVRVRNLDNTFTALTERNEKNRTSKLPVIRDTADVTALIMATGLRPGSDDDRGAEHKAYGAVTLLGKHVIADASGVSLKYIPGKSHGVEKVVHISNPSVAKMLRRRAGIAGANGKLFPETNEKRLSGYIKTLSGGKNHTKDLRTYVANKTAALEMKTMPAPKTELAYKKSVHEIAKRVAAKLNNTVAVALSSYINPVIFAEWRAGIKTV